MSRLTPAFLLGNTGMVSAAAPWCRPLDNLELGILLLAQPWLSGDGMRRARMQQELARLAEALPLGPTYFQRIKRSVSRLETTGLLDGSGDGRSRRFAMTPAGFASFILNLRVLRADPTVDGSEFELKRAVVSLWNIALDRLAELPDGASLPPRMEAFLDDVERLEVHGQRVITADVVGGALDLLQLVAAQRERVERLLESARTSLHAADRDAETLRSLDLSRVAAGRGMHDAASLLDASPETLAMVRDLVTGVLPRLSLRAAVLRYESYLRYLDGLSSLYARELTMPPIESLRGLLSRKRG